MDTYRAVEVLVDVGVESPGRWQLGSGFVFAPGQVLTAAHVVTDARADATPQVWVRDLHGREWPASVTACDSSADAAALEVPGLAPNLPVSRIGRVDRERVGVVEGVTGVGFPGFKTAPEKPKALRRQPGQADGWVPTSENYSGGELAFKLRAVPERVRRGSPWEGFSGSGVFVGDVLLGVAVTHRPGEGPGSLTVCPVTSFARMSPSGGVSFLEVMPGLSPDRVETVTPGPYDDSVYPTGPQVGVRVDRLLRYTRRDPVGLVVFGTLTLPDELVAYGEGVRIQATVENGSRAPAVVTTLDAVVLGYDSTFVGEYPTTRPANPYHLEVPRSVRGEPVVLDQLTALDEEAPVSETQLALDPAGEATAHHTLDFTVVAGARGLWTLALRAHYVDPARPGELHEARSEPFRVVKQ